MATGKREMRTICAAIFATLAVSVVFANAWDGVLLKGRTDKDNPVGYKAGEKIVFALVASEVPAELENAGYSVNWKRTGDDGKVESGKVPFRSGEVCKVVTKLGSPGFVRLEAYVVDANGKRVMRDKLAPGAPAWERNQKAVFFDGGAGVDVDKIGRFTPEPKDFDTWWKKQRQLLATVPLKATRKDVKTFRGVKIYEIYVDCCGPRPVTGYLLIPDGAKPKSCKVRCTFQGYGFYKQGCPEWAAAGCKERSEIFLEINAHGYELGREQSYYDAFVKGIQPKGYAYAFSPEENAKPETAYFRFMAMRVLRALEYVKTLPEWNGKDLVAEGASQGGLQASWAAGLDPDVSLALPSVTWGCNFAATEPGGLLHGGWFIKYAPGLEYFDAISHIARAKCPVEIRRVGLGDYVCPPSGQAAFYNAIKTPKSILWVQGSQHGLVPPQPNQTYCMKNGSK